MINVNFDGSFQPAAGGRASIGVVIEKDDIVIKEISKLVDAGTEMSSNLAEYMAAKTALELLCFKLSNSK